MDRHITRRDLLHGMGALAATYFVPGNAFADAVLAAEQTGLYPPALTGLRGSHVGSFEVAHQLAREGKRDWGPVTEADDGLYDLIVVGAGLSGLAAAHFYLKEHPDARILILDNHDDFGGHAKRNEFTVGGEMVIGYGGSQTIQEPSGYPRVAKELLRDLQIDLGRFETAFDQDFYRKHDLAGALYFNREKWGVDRLIRFDFGSLPGYLPLAAAGTSPQDAVAAMPISEPARVQMLHILTANKNVLPGMSAGEREEYLYSISYREFLTKHLGVTEPEVFAVLQDQTADLGAGIESTRAGSAIFYCELPGIEAVKLPGDEFIDPYIHHFPDGNAGIARLLVRKMIPASSPGSSMDDIVKARFDYGALDRDKDPVRLRLNSTVVNVRQNLSGQEPQLRAGVLQRDDPIVVSGAAKGPARGAR